MTIGSFLNGVNDPVSVEEPELTISQTARSSDSFDILRIALGQAGLTTTFNRPGDFTVFAPTDDAFRELASETLGLDIEGLLDGQVAVALIDALGLETITQVLTYHVSPEGESLAELTEQGSIDTLFGTDVTIAGDVIIDEAKSIENPEFIRGLTDIATTNGTIHAIDKVLLPLDLDPASEAPTIAEIASGNDSFEVLTAALTATGLVGVFTDLDADFTVFAPTDDAFAALAGDLGLDIDGLTPDEIAGALVTALGVDTVISTLLYHVSGESLSLGELQDDIVVDTEAGLRLFVDGNELVDLQPGLTNPEFIDGLTDIEAVNGTIHAIDYVLIPADLLGAPGGLTDGTNGDDVLVGSASDDRLRGLDGADVLAGADGDDTSIGSGGGDTFIDGAGNDRFSGGAGRDVFDMTQMDGNNRVLDFRSGIDTLVLSSDDFDSVEEALESAFENSLGMRINVDGGSLTLVGMTDVTADDFALF